MAAKKLLSVGWPLLGLDESSGYENQRPGTCIAAKNVRSFDPLTDQARGASGPGYSLYTPTDMGFRVKCIDHIALSVSLGTGTDTVASRSVKLIAVVDDGVGGSALWLVTSGSATSVGSGLNANAPAIFSAPHFTNIFFADGTTDTYYDASGGTIEDWSTDVTAGTLPTNGGAKPTLIDNWRGRIVLSGLAGDRQNWFMSRVGDAFDWNYSPAYTDEAQAVAGNNAAAGKSPDIINTLIPVNDDILLFGCDHSIWAMRGDPMAGGRIDAVSEAMGMPWGRPWCKDEMGRVYFFASKGGVYVITPEGMPQEISQPIRDRLTAINLSTTLIRMVYSAAEQGIYVFLSPVNDPGSNSTHYFYDLRLQAWWPVVFNPSGGGNWDPRAVHTYDGDSPNDRVILLGTNAGFLRKIDLAADDDTGRAIDSYVWLGPIRLNGLSEVLYELQVTLGANSDAVTYAVYSGNSAEEAFNSTAKFTGTLSVAGRNPSIRDRCFGDSIYIKLSNSTLDKSWTFEKITATLKVGGRTRQRTLQ